MADVLHDPNVLPDDLPAPQNDGAARHLVGMKLPDIGLAATDGTEVRRCRPVGTPSLARVAARRNPAASEIISRS